MLNVMEYPLFHAILNHFAKMLRGHFAVRVENLSWMLSQMVVWRSGSTLVSINEVNLRWAWLVTGMGDRVQVQFPVRDIYLSM